MKISKLEIIVISIALILTIFKMISAAFPVRVAGQNILSANLWQYAVVAILLVTRNDLFKRDSMKLLYIYILVYLILELFGHYDLQSGRATRYIWMYYQHFSLGICLLIREYVYYKDDIRISDKIFRVIVASYLIAFFFNIIAVINNPQAVRGFDASFDLSGVGTYRALGVAGYGFASSVPFILPIAVYKAKIALKTYQPSKVIFWTGFILLAMISTYLSVYIAPLILSVLLLTLAILGRKRIKLNSIMIFLIIILYIITPKYIVSDLIRTVGNASRNYEIEKKFNDLALIVEGGIVIEEGISTKNDLEYRASRISLNLRRFSESPIIGKGTSSEGEHIYWLNLLAQYGVIGTIPLIILIIYSVKRDYSLLRDDYKFFYLLSLVGFILLGFMKAVLGVEMFIIPFLLAPISSPRRKYMAPFSSIKDKVDSQPIAYGKL